MKNIFSMIIGFVVLYSGCSYKYSNLQSSSDSVYHIKDNIDLAGIPQWEKERMVFSNRLGFNTIEAGREVIVSLVYEPTLKDMILPGDVILQLNSNKVLSKSSYVKILDSLDIELVCTIKIKKGNNVSSINIRPGKNYYESSLYSEIERLLLGNKIAITVVSSSNSGSCADNPEADKNDIAAVYESHLLQIFKADDKFSLVDRALIDKILAEQKLSLSGAIDEKTRVEIGKVTGVTHIIFLTICRYSDGFGCTEKIIELKTGKILVSNSYTRPYGK
ncbi:MAG: hypothetical protein A2452_12180 [Candidatus Firestonebacteria bacterium RIFOXYC2_FULL_39_67]|nr:MAG: hypothetical protein A2536_07710 [Candidatus Firestonebacteria bacterium RIFOXYD2_FULL_39_29]OGF55606.1 MAG: hypothetical protein A2452_12180 [Candidatus Firestonebacteria bacterium RIFOXYC2_FULL_39_67]